VALVDEGESAATDEEPRARAARATVTADHRALELTC
jgi:hypothetical protein